MSTLELRSLRTHPMPAWSSQYGEILAEAASVCLDSQGHPSGVTMDVVGVRKAQYSISYSPVPESVARSWADIPYAVEHGAYGITALLIQELTGLTILERSRKGTGFDLWLGLASDKSSLFDKKARLEVSGILNEDHSNSIQSRVNRKLRQIALSGNQATHYVSVVEFGHPRSHLEKKEG